ncbi:MAG TPA: M24 family metallopeptidase [Chloroflexota bacterium]|nr:M24 family metallopeptidase [Chloroflexota bacterium]
MAELIDLPRLTIAERDRRWARVRRAMDERDLACIITPPHTGHWELYAADTRYLTHIGGNCSETACVFPRQGDVTAIVLNRPEFWSRAQEWVGDLRTPKRHTWSAPMIDRMRELKLDRAQIGVVGLEGGVRTPEGTIPHRFFEAFRAAFPNATFVDVTVMMAELRAVKSPEELSVMERAAAIAEEAIRGFVDAARPGVPDYQVYAALYHRMLMAGGEVPTMVLWGTGSGQVRDAFLPTRRPLQPGDRLDNEIDGKYMGYVAQRVQPAVLGDAPAPLRDAMEMQRTVFNAALERMTPGTRFGEIASAIDDVAQEIGCKATLTMHGRGLGEDRPLLVGGEMTPEIANFVLQEGNAFIVKPNVRREGGPGITWGDTVAVTASGGRRLGTQPHDLIVIPC